MKKSIALSMLAAAVLTGCGGGGGGSSSSPAPVVTKYNLQFLQFADAADVTSNTCTLFDTDRQTPGMESFAKVAADVVVKVFDNKGDFVKSLTVSTDGKLTVTANDVPDGGYLSVIDSPSDTDHFFKVLSIQKSLLSNSIISVNRNQGAVDCYEKDKTTDIKKGYASIRPNGVNSDSYGYVSSQNNIAPANFISREVEAKDQESVLVQAYHSGEVTGYAFVSTLTANAGEEQEPITAVDTLKYAWSIQLPVNTLDALSVRLNKNDFSYPWLNSVSFTKSDNTTSDFAYVTSETDWSYSAKGTSFSWDFQHNDILGASLDVSLPTDFTLTDNDPVVQQAGVNYEFQVPGFTSTTKRLQRSRYERSPNAMNTLRHIIYSEVDAGEEVIIPKLELASLDPIGATEIKVDILSADTITDELKTFFMRENASASLVSAVLSPAKTVEHDKVKYMNTYTLLSR